LSKELFPVYQPYSTKEKIDAKRIATNRGLKLTAVETRMTMQEKKDSRQKNLRRKNGGCYEKKIGKEICLTTGGEETTQFLGFLY
jgi:hypothetical protein